MKLTPWRSFTCCSASIRGSAPLTRSSSRSSVSRPPPPPQQKVASCVVPGAMSWKWLATALMISRGMTNWPPGMLPMREARATLHESWKVMMRSSFFSLSNFSAPALDQVVGELADVLRHRVARIEPVERADQRVPEAVGHAPGMAAFADDDALDAQALRFFLHAQRDLAHLLVVADEQREVGRLAGLGADRPADAGGMEHLGVADQAFHMRLGEEVGRGRDQQHFGALHVEREAHVQRRSLPWCLLPGRPGCRPAPARGCPGCCRCGGPCR